MANSAKKPQSNAKLTDWVRLLSDLGREVKAWSDVQKWPVAVLDNQLTEENLGTYQADILRIRTPKGEVRLEPIGLRVIGAEGRVDLTAWPSMNRVKLVRQDGKWRVFTDSNVSWPNPWGKDTFVSLAKELAASA